MKLKDDQPGIEKRRQLVASIAAKYTQKSVVIRKVSEIAKVNPRTVYRDLNKH